VYAVVEALAVAIPLQIEVKEGAVLALVKLGKPHRPAHGETVVVELLGRSQMGAVLSGVGERNARVQRLIRGISVCAAVVLIGAAARREIEKAARYLAEL